MCEKSRFTAFIIRPAVVLFTNMVGVSVLRLLQLPAYQIVPSALDEIETRKPCVKPNKGGLRDEKTLVGQVRT